MAGLPPLQPPADRRRAIEAAAATVFAESGFAAATVDEIVRRSGVSKPAVYRTYPSKSHVYAAVLERAAASAADAALGALAGSGTAPPGIAAMIDAWFAQVERDPVPYRLALRDVPDDPVVRAAVARVTAMQLENDRRLIGRLAPGVPPDEVDPLAEALRGALLAVAAWWLDRPDVPREVPVATMTRLCESLVSGADAANDS